MTPAALISPVHVRGAHGGKPRAISLSMSPSSRLSKIWSGVVCVSPWRFLFVDRGAEGVLDAHSGKADILNGEREPSGCSPALGLHRAICPIVSCDLARKSLSSGCDHPIAPVAWLAGIVQISSGVAGGCPSSRTVANCERLCRTLSFLRSALHRSRSRSQSMWNEVRLRKLDSTDRGWIAAVDDHHVSELLG